MNSFLKITRVSNNSIRYVRADWVIEIQDLLNEEDKSEYCKLLLQDGQEYLVHESSTEIFRQLREIRRAQ